VIDENGAGEIFNTEETTGEDLNVNDEKAGERGNEDLESENQKTGERVGEDSKGVDLNAEPKTIENPEDKDPKAE